MPVTEWNYKGIDSIKYIGPMAQDFYAAFHLGGNDSLGINTLCIDGVNMASIQALILRTDGMKIVLNELVAAKAKVEKLEKEVNRLSAIEVQNRKQDEMIEMLNEKLNTLLSSTSVDNKIKNIVSIESK